MKGKECGKEKKKRKLEHRKPASPASSSSQPSASTFNTSSSDESKSTIEWKLQNKGCSKGLNGSYRTGQCKS